MLQLSLPAAATPVRIACPNAVAKITSISINSLARNAALSVSIWADAAAYQAGAAPVKEVSVYAGASQPARQDVQRDEQGNIVLDAEGKPVLVTTQPAQPGYAELVEGEYADEYAAIAESLYAFLMASQPIFANATPFTDPV